MCGSHSSVQPAKQAQKKENKSENKEKEVKAHPKSGRSEKIHP
jgi:hypothetical protein